MYHYGLLIVLLNFSPDVRGSISQGELDRHLELGKDFLAKGQLQDALTQYHAAVEGDPNNYLTYYKRGTVYLALGKPKFALLDLQKVLELKPDFIAARLQRANVLLKQAEFNAAQQDYYDVLKAERDVESNNRRVASFWLDKIDPTEKDYHEALSLIQRKKHKDAAELLTSVIEVCPWAPKLRELRAKCYHELGEYLNAISDIRFTTKLVPGNAAGYFQVSTLLYQLGLVDESLKEIRECLKLDSEHKDCFPAYKKIKKVAKHLNDANNAHEVEESRDPEACVNSAKLVLKFEPDVENVRFTAFHILCKCNSDIDAAAAIENCQKALKIRKEPTVLCDSAEAYLAAEMFDDAIRTLKDALEIDSSFSRAKEMLQKAQQRQKMSESRDYYKILGVRRTASKKEIIKAYRKAAQKWHPDNFPDENEKKRAEKKFIDIASAKEVLTDEEKRAKFDRGEDPLDPESGKHSGFNSFQEFSQFHGSPFQFKFHFN